MLWEKYSEKYLNAKSFHVLFHLLFLTLHSLNRQLGYTFNIKVKGEKVFKYYIDVLCLAIAAKAQITGEIYDSDGYPIPLASAIYKGHHVAAASDMDGKFTIARHNGWELTFSSVGFIPQTIKVGPNTPSHMKIVLKEDSKTLGEVVIKQKRERYSRKNNPAVELMKRVIAAKKLSHLENNDYYHTTNIRR